MGSILAALVALAIPVLVYRLIISRLSENQRKIWYTVLLAVMGVLYVPVTMQLVFVFVPIPAGVGLQAGVLFLVSFFRFLIILPVKHAFPAWCGLLIPAVTGALLMTRQRKLREKSFAQHAVLMLLYVLLFWIALFVLIFLLLLIVNLIGSIIAYVQSMYTEVIFRF